MKQTSDLEHANTKTDTAQLSMITPVDTVGSQSQSQSLAGLGYGYNIFGSYIPQECLLKPIFDINKIKGLPGSKNISLYGNSYEIPNFVSFKEPIQGNFQDIKQIGANTLLEFERKLGESVGLTGNYAFFPDCAVKYAIPFNPETDKEFYCLSQCIVNAARFEIDPQVSATDCSQFLLPEVKDILENQALSQKQAFEFFENYGTHYVRGMMVGGSLFYSSKTDCPIAYSNKDIADGAKYAFESSASSSEEKVYHDFKKQIDYFTSVSHVQTYVQGGDKQFEPFNPSIATDTFAETSKKAWDFIFWSQSIGNFPEFCDLTEEEPLVPIWQLCTNAEIMGRLEVYYHEYASMKSEPARVTFQINQDITENCVLGALDAMAYFAKGRQLVKFATVSNDINDSTVWPVVFFTDDATPQPIAPGKIAEWKYKKHSSSSHLAAITNSLAFVNSLMYEQQYYCQLTSAVDPVNKQIYLDVIYPVFTEE